MKQRCLIVEFMTNAIIFTPPRTGRNFLQRGFEYCSGVLIESNNSNTNLELEHFDSVISIVRDPKEVIASLSTMIKEKEGVTFTNDVRAAENVYNSFMQVIVNSNNLIYKYSDLTNNTNRLFENIGKKLNININRPYDHLAVLEIMERFEKNNVFGYKRTFTTYDRYKESMSIIDILDLSQSYYLYNVALDKSQSL